jgi:HPt (histidine-containing phosphotransfer) domain-containing protein
MTERTSRLGNTLDHGAIERLVATCGDGGADIVVGLITILFDEAPTLLAELRHAVTAGDTESTGRAAHTLKSHGMTFGAPFLAHIAREIELQARHENLDGAATLLTELEGEYGRAHHALDTLRHQLHRPTNADLAA